VWPHPTIPSFRAHRLRYKCSRRDLIHLQPGLCGHGQQVYQIAPGFYVVRSTDPTQNPTVIMLPLPGVPQAPNTGPIPGVIH